MVIICLLILVVVPVGFVLFMKSIEKEVEQSGGIPDLALLAALYIIFRNKR